MTEEQTTEQASGLRPFEYAKHFDYGLLRNRPPSIMYEMLKPDGWHAMTDFNPYTASMSTVDHPGGLEEHRQEYGPDIALDAPRVMPDV